MHKQFMPNKYKQSKTSLFQKYLLFIFRQNILDFDIHTCLLVLFAHVFYIIYIFIYTSKKQISNKINDNFRVLRIFDQLYKSSGVPLSALSYRKVAFNCTDIRNKKSH